MLLAAKVLVISRLLHKKLSQRPKPLPYLESLRNRLTALRRKLLARIDSRFKSLDLSGDGLVEAMCGFSLATSSSQTDVLRHFHHVRQEAMSAQCHKADRDHEGSLQALRIYVKTLKDTQTLVPGHLARALERLKSVPMFKSPDLYSLIELNLDVHERWIGDDIRTFKPYIRQDDLQRSEAERLLRTWAKQGFGSFLSDLKDRIQNIDEPLIIVQLRRRILELWFSNNWHSVGINSSEALDGLRDAFNIQLTRLVHSRVASLTEVTLTIQSTLHEWQIEESDRSLSLWDSSMTSTETSSGANPFRETLLATISGRTSSLQSVLNRYTTWLTRISAIEATIRSLQSETWDDDFEDIENNLLPNKQALLSSDDPHALQQELSNSLATAFRTLESSLEILPDATGEHDRGHTSGYLLRIFRELRQHLPPSYQNRALGLDSIPNLHEILANAALAIPWRKCQGRMRSTKFAGRRLWEGDPELPVLPSPWAFRLLKELVLFMTEFGVDLWSPSATDLLKQNLRGKLKLELAKPLPSAAKANGYSTAGPNGDMEEAKETNGIAHPSSSNSPNITDVCIQRVFDSFYLMQVVAPKNSNQKGGLEDDACGNLNVGLREGFALEQESIEKLEKGAEEYWKRTTMLFGLLG